MFFSRDRSGGSIKVDQDAQVLGDLTVKRNTRVSTIDVQDKINVNGDSNLAGMNVSSDEVVINGLLLVKSDVIVHGSLFLENLKVREVLNASKILSSGILIDGNISATNGMVESSGGFWSKNGILECKNITAGVITSTKGIMASNVFLSGHVASDTLRANSGIFNDTLSATTFVTKHIDVESGPLQINSELTIRGNAYTKGKFKAKEVEVENGIKAKSVFSSRAYVGDVAASGFVSAATLVIKGEAKFKGTMSVDTSIATNTLEAIDAKFMNGITCRTAGVAGTLDVGSVEARKVSISGELKVGNEDIKAKIGELEKRLHALETIMRELKQPSQSVFNNS